MPIQITKDVMDFGKPLETNDEIVEKLVTKWTSYIKVTPKMVMQNFDVSYSKALRIANSVNIELAQKRIDGKTSFKFPMQETDFNVILIKEGKVKVK
jgi:hypothetical protein